MPDSAGRAMDVVQAVRHLVREPDLSVFATGPGEIQQDAGSLVRQIGRAFDPPESGRPVCLAVSDPALFAAALIASLQSGVPLVFPYNHSENALAELHRAIPYDRMISDRPRPAPDKVSVILPGRAGPPESRPDTAAALSPDAPWVYLFTGGSSGAPKRWSKTPRNLLAEVLFLADHFNVTPGDRILATVPPYHIYGLLYAVLLPLLTGARARSLATAYPREIFAAIRDFSPTILISIPVHYRTLARPWDREHAIRLAFSSTGPLRPEIGEAFTQASGIPVVEVFGSTETGGIATRCRSRGETAFFPYSCVDMRAEEGRLMVRSDFLSPELERDAGGYFRTADHIEPAGTGGFIVKGRFDGVAKVGGRRVDLERVREVLLEMDGVEDAAVIAGPATGSRESEILAVVQGRVTEKEVRSRLEPCLEPWCRPRAICVVSRVPRTAAGKIDRPAIEALF